MEVNKKKDLEVNEPEYRTAKMWQIIGFPLGSSAQIIFMMMMTVLSFYVTGIAGLGVVIVSLAMTGTRIFDGLTDPLIGLLIDRTEGRFGKIRPFLIGGYLITVVFAFLIFFTVHYVPESFRLIYFIIIYAIYMLGYSTLMMGNTAAQPILTNDPKQRPVIGGISMLYNTIVGAGFSMYIANAAVRYGGFNNIAIFHEMFFVFAIISLIMITVSVLAIAPIDHVENFGSLSERKHKPTVKDMVSTLKGNRPFQMFIIAAVSDRLAQQIANNSVIAVMIFGIIIGDFGLSGTLAGIGVVTNLIFVFFGVRFLGKLGAKKMYVINTWISIGVAIIIPLILLLGDPTQIRLNNIGLMTVAFLVFQTMFTGLRVLGNLCVSPMIPDVVDYERYRSERFAPGTVTSIYSIIDKGVGSFCQTIVGLAVAAIGFTEALPDINTPYSESIFLLAMFLGYGVLILTWVLSLVCMKFYMLDKEKMKEIQRALKARDEELEKSNHSSDESSASVGKREQLVLK